MALAPIYGGGQGQRTEPEVISIIEHAVAHPNFRSLVVVTVGNRGADYLSFADYTNYHTVLNYSQLSISLKKSSWYRTHLVAKETEPLLSKDGSQQFPLSFHLLYKDTRSNPSGYITTSNTRVPYYCRLDPVNYYHNSTRDQSNSQ